MSQSAIGILHPGAMGVSVAASARNSGNPVYWVSDGRSADTRARAQQYDLNDAGTLTALCATCDVILSVCPPDSAERVARAVIEAGFRGLYCDANAIAPQRAVRIGEILNAKGIDFVDGGIIGGPAWKRGETFLHLAGPRAADIAALFTAGPLETNVLGTRIGQASALKMCYAAYTKGTTALLSAILAAAEQLDVRQALYREWTRDDPAMVERTENRVIRSTAKAWRFEGEMNEISATFQAVGLPGDFHLAAAEIYHRLAEFKDTPSAPTLEQVLATLHPST